jgi:hypothetical protein
MAAPAAHGVMAWWQGLRERAESSTRLVLAIVFLTNMTDNLLLTAVGK